MTRLSGAPSLSTLLFVMPTTETNTYDADEWGQYRSLSTMAVVALVLGICSVVMFASPLMVVVPLAAVAAALLALKSIAASDGGLSGGRLAYWGLALAIVFGVASVSRVQVRDRLLQGQADRVARQWLSLAADGNAEGMLDLMTKSATSKLSPPTDPNSPTMPFLSDILAPAMIRQDPLVLELRELQEAGSPHFQLEDEDVDATIKPPQAFFRYVAKGDAKGGQKQLSCFVVLKRFQTPGRQAIWLVDSWQIE